MKDYTVIQHQDGTALALHRREAVRKLRTKEWTAHKSYDDLAEAQQKADQLDETT